MKQFLAILLAASLSLSIVGCAPQQPSQAEELFSTEGTVLSRADEEPLVPETEFPKPEDDPGLESSAAPVGGEPESKPEQSSAPTPSSSQSSAASSQAPPQSQSSVPSKQEASSSGAEEFLSAAEEGQKGSSAGNGGNGGASAISGEVRAMWFSFYELSAMTKGRSKAQFQSSIEAAFENCADMGLNTMIVQVRPHGDALYPSDYFPWSRWMDAGGKEGRDPGYDPLEIMVSAAHAMGLRIEAWINPYRIRTDSAALSSDNPAAVWLDEGNDNVIRFKGGLYYNPAREEVRQLIVDGVTEIVRNYDVDGIHFDDYFYPSPDDSFDQEAYDEYRAEGGSKDRGSWRRNNVDTLVKSVYQAIKSVNSNCLFGISPSGNVSNNYNLLYIDTEKWVTNSGYVDYICPQIYWGMNNTAAPFATVADTWSRMIGNSKVKLYVGLAAYKIGGNEKDFSNNDDNLMEQVLYSRDLAHYKGFMLFRYDSLFNPASDVKAQVQRERQNLESILD